MPRRIDVTMQLIDKVTQPLNTIRGRLQQHANQWNRMGKSIMKTGKNITKTGQALTKGITAPVAAAGVGCIKASADFESGMANVEAISGKVTKGELKNLQKQAEEMGVKFKKGSDETSTAMNILAEQAKKMGQTTKFSSTEATEAYKYMAQAGWKAGDMMNGISGIMHLAGATGEDLASTSDIVTDALTAFGLTAKDTNNFVDVLAKTASSSNTNVAMLGEAFQYTAPLCGQLKFNIKDTSVALGLMANSGIKASNAGTAMRSWLTRMAKPTKESKNAMDKLGLSMTDSKGKMKSLATIMNETRDAFKGLTEKQKTSMAAALAGKTGMSGLLAVVGSADKDFNKLTKSIKNSNGACDKMYKTTQKGLKGQLVVLKSSVESLAQAFGDRMAPYVKQLTTKIQNLVTKFNSLSDKQKDAVVKFALMAAVVGPVLTILGKIVTMFGKNIRSIANCIKHMKEFGTTAKNFVKNARKIKEALVSVKGAVARFGSTLVRASKNALTKSGTILVKIGKNFLKLGKTIASAGKMAGTKAVGMFKKIPGLLLSPAGKITIVIALIAGAIFLIVKNWSKIKPFLLKVKNWFVKTFQKIKEALQPFFNLLEVGFRLSFSVAIGVFDTFKQTVKGVFSGIKDIFGGIIKFISGVFTGNWKKAWEGVKQIFSGIFKTFSTIAKTPINAVINIINAAIRSLNKINVKIPKWVPGLGGKNFGINIPTIPALASGTNNWKGGIVQVHEKGGEIIDLPKGTRVYPHDKSIQKAYKDGSKSGGTKVYITIPKIADNIVVREDADIDKIAEKIAEKLERKAKNIGGGDIGYIY